MTQRHANQHQQVVSSVERKLVGDLQEHNMSAISRELEQLSHMESRSIFKHDLARINHDLQTHGWLPGLRIVHNGDEFSVQPDGRAGEEATAQGGRRRRGHRHFRGNPESAADNGQPDAGQAPEQLGAPRMRGRQSIQDSPVAQDNPAARDDSTFYGQPGASPSTKRDMAKLVADEARRQGVDPYTAVASMLAESGGNPRKPGDYVRGVPTSFGLFQLHKHGELGSMSPEQAYDPNVNARVALSHFRETQNKYGGRLSPGWLAALSQAPKHKTAYAFEVDHRLAEAHRLLDS